MPGTEPYIKPCNNCAKQIILGIDPETSKWRPWDNYATKEKHNCKTLAQAADIETIAAGKNASTSELAVAANEEIQALHKNVSELGHNVAMIMWMLEKVAKKVGVDDLIDDTSK